MLRMFRVRTNLRSSSHGCSLSSAFDMNLNKKLFFDRHFKGPQLGFGVLGLGQFLNCLVAKVSNLKF